MHFWSFWAKYCHFLHILSNARPKTNVNKVPRWVFRYVGYKTFNFSSKKQDFLPKNDQIWPEIGIFDHLGPIGGLVGGCGCISQEPYLLYYIKSVVPFFIIITIGKISSFFNAITYIFAQIYVNEVRISHKLPCVIRRHCMTNQKTGTHIKTKRDKHIENCRLLRPRKRLRPRL